MKNRFQVLIGLGVGLLMFMAASEVTRLFQIEAASTDVQAYWTDWSSRKIQSANLDGTNVQDLVTIEVGHLGGIALDVVRRKMYWTDIAGDKIQRANLDGTKIEDVVTTGLLFPNDIAVDAAGGKIYWTDWGTRKIQRANLDGSNVQDLVTTGLSFAYHIVLDVAGGKIYWTDWGTHKIQRANLDGTDVQDLVTNAPHPEGIALDLTRGKMYWTDAWSHKIRRANLDGTNIEDLVTSSKNRPVSIGLDVAGNKMYWIEQNSRKLRRASLDGTNIEDLVTTGLGGGLFDIVLSFSSEVPSIVWEDVNEDGVVNLQDIIVVVKNWEQTGENKADVNKDGIVDFDDLVLVLAAITDAAGAPALRAQALLTGEEIQQWLTTVKLSGDISPAYRRSIQVLEQLLAMLTPQETVLLPNYPNPFNPETWIPYQLAIPSDVTLSIYSADGKLVRTLDLGHKEVGIYQNRSHAAYWNGKNENGESVASGVYFYTLTAGKFTASRKMLIRK